MYLGSFAIDDYLPIPAVTHRFSSGAAYAASAISYSIYKAGGTTGLFEDVDMTPAAPFDGVTGLYYARRQLTTVAGFVAGSDYIVVVKATVDSVSALDVHTFQIRAKVNADAVWDAVRTDHQTAGTFGEVETSDDVATAVWGVLPTFAVATDAGNSATSFKTTRTETDTDYWKDALAVVTSGVLLGQVKKVTGYNGTTKVITVSGGFTGTPADGVTGLLLNR